MQELVGRLTALDPAASETLKVVSYFDALVAGGVGLPALLRGAAVLAGAVVGARSGPRSHRFGPDGARRDEPAATSGQGPGTTARAEQADGAGWPSRPTADGQVWLEREGPQHVNDDMIVERLAIAVDLVAARHTRDPGGSLGIALDGTRDLAERRTALARLRLGTAGDVRVAVVPTWHDAGAAAGVPATVVATPHGLVRAVVLGTGARVVGPAGVGLAGPADHLPDSFGTAVLALRLLPGFGSSWADGNAVSRARADRAEPEVLDAADLGVLLAAVSALEPVAAQQPDVVRLAGLDVQTLAVLDELVRADSVRAAATHLGMHHSTLQARHDGLTEDLGYDPRGTYGRARFQLARLLLRLVGDR